MYEQHFGLSERPFSIAPDPRFLYMSQRHREALAHLLYGVGEGGGFVQLTGEVGTGKTTICRSLLGQLPDNVDVALILNPRVSSLELISTLCDELQISYPAGTQSIKVLTDALNEYLIEAHAKGRRTVMVIDEAQNLDADALEQVRLLTNLETTQEKLLQIILIGQPELRDLLARDDLRQLSQRITARYHLEPITDGDTSAYIRHRLEVCGGTEMVFNDKAVKLIQDYSDGIPRLINVLCDRSLLGAYVEGKRVVTSKVVRRAAAEILPEETNTGPEKITWWSTALVAIVSVMLALWLAPKILQQFDSSVEYSAATGAAVTGSAETVVPPPPPLEGLSAAVSPLAAETETAEIPVKVENKPELEALLGMAGNATTRHAWSGLFREWGYQSTASTDQQACAQARRVLLRCLQRSGSWNAVTRYQRPVLLQLAATDGRRVPVLLSAIDADQATIAIDGKEFQVTPAEIQRFWFGNYQLLWQVPPGGNTVLRPGNQGSDVVWLKEQLQVALGLSAAQVGSRNYNQELKSLVERFQRVQGLKADGVAGPETLIHLNTATKRPGVPLLQDNGAAKSTPTRLSGTA